MAGWGQQRGQQGCCLSLNVCRAETQNCGWEGVTNSMRKSCGDQGKQTHVHSRKERKGGESGMMGRKAQKDMGLLFVLTKADLGLTHAYESDNGQKTF